MKCPIFLIFFLAIHLTEAIPGFDWPSFLLPAEKNHTWYQIGSENAAQICQYDCGNALCKISEYNYLKYFFFSPVGGLDPDMEYTPTLVWNNTFIIQGIADTINKNIWPPIDGQLDKCTGFTECFNFLNTYYKVNGNRAFIISFPEADLAYCN